jgi:hypothetical protein
VNLTHFKQKKTINANGLNTEDAEAVMASMLSGKVITMKQAEAELALAA